MDTPTASIGLFFLLLVLASPLFIAVEALFGREGILNRKKPERVPPAASQVKQAGAKERT